MSHAPAETVSRLNLRDLGGAVAGDGLRVATGLVFRSGTVHDPTPQDLSVLEAIGAVEVFDLRTDAERADLVSPWPAPTVQVLDVMGADAKAAPARLRDVLLDPDRAREEMGEGRATAFFAEAYRRFVTSPQSRAAYAGLLRRIAHAEWPIAFHCTAGKDRTGWAAALLLEILSVPREAVVADYLQTSAASARMVEAYSDAYAAAGGDVDVLVAALSADPAYLQAAYDAVEATWGDMSSYARLGLGLTDEEVTKLRGRLLTDVGDGAGEPAPDCQTDPPTPERNEKP